MTDFTLKLATPLWTGGPVPGEMDRVHETSLIGTLRWWYEAFVRGFGDYACSPANHSCELDPKKFSKELKNYICTHEESTKMLIGEKYLCRECLQEILSGLNVCPVCQVFGTTGWARMFRIVIIQKDDSEPSVPFPKTVGQRNNTLKGYCGEISISLEPRLKGDKITVPMILSLVDFVQKYASFGQNTSYSYGICSLKDPASIGLLPPKSFLKIIKDNCKYKNRECNGEIYPSLKYMFFGARKATAWEQKDIREFQGSLCSVKEQKKFKVSYGYMLEDNELRYFGWLSPATLSSTTPEIIRNLIEGLGGGSVTRFWEGIEIVNYRTQ